jgi:molybdate transport system permease protein
MSRRHRHDARPPIVLSTLGTIAVVFFVLPLVALAIRVPWSSLFDALRNAATREALLLSVVTSLITTFLAVIFGVPLAWLLARSNMPGRQTIRALCTLSMVLPPVVAGVALLASLGRRGVVGQILDDWFGVRLPFTMPAVIVAQLFVAMPFLVLTVESGFARSSTTVEEAARTLGATPWYVFSRVTIPATRPAIVAGAVLTWARALGEFGATITFAGNFPGATRTLPIATYLALETNVDDALLISMLMVVLSLVILVALRGRWVGAIGGVR